MFVNIKCSLDVLKILKAKLFCISTFTYGLLGLYKKNFTVHRILFGISKFGSMVPPLPLPALSCYDP